MQEIFLIPQRCTIKTFAKHFFSQTRLWPTFWEIWPTSSLKLTTFYFFQVQQNVSQQLARNGFTYRLHGEYLRDIVFNSFTFHCDHKVRWNKSRKSKRKHMAFRLRSIVLKVKRKITRSIDFFSFYYTITYISIKSF